jgi:YHS domain-containing protein
MRGEADEGVAVDPVCGRPLLTEDAERLVHRGRTVHFCSTGCRDRFARAAERVRLDEALHAGWLFNPGERPRWGTA